MRLIGTAASGLRAQQLEMDTIGDNLANADTPGFKANQMVFAEALATEVRSGRISEENANTVDTLDVGAGVLYSGINTNLQQGVLKETDRSLDLGINGDGYFQVMTPEGELAYTRAGALQIDGSGQLADMQGNIVQTNGLIPAGATDVAIAENGDITGVSNGESMVFGQLVLAGFQNPQGLQRTENNLFVPTANSGEAQVGQPGSATAGNLVLGTIRSKSLEMSNVDMATSMTDLIQAQRAYQVNARLVQDGDQMWGIANALRR
ncbi:flagellar hook-basal body proteins [Desulfosporosinus orientis DSM 765]|uniref:Flagellar hook-basal body proteins n=1 Tax=Desulfosporosinus orientis (strain ATCC 19365 / DSM 765 / NCIMB 8382 / VKM B-1628 / Singapore I) TaxID=768706 RepID=G7WHW8_DESOD|nr:flagellar hook-basal body complex protein [Desulfosporosinus orientis]AET70265.1 flagellar hook-basal body proteins [Desulfosporosinus orientis DSM 765]